MKKTFLAVLLFHIFIGIAIAQSSSKSTEYKILLTGASFASPQNGWFEIGCRKLNAQAINRAIGGEAIANTANRMADGTLYSKEELEEIDALVIMQVHNKDVYEELQLKDKYTNYEVPFDRSNYAAAYDYVIKRYITECYELRNDTTSKYYNTPYGKPAIIASCHPKAIQPTIFHGYPSDRRYSLWTSSHTGRTLIYAATNGSYFR